jgi:hypothetical protein
MSAIDEHQLEHVGGGARVYSRSTDWQLQLGLQQLKGSLDSVTWNNNQQNQNVPLLLALLLGRR